MTGGGYMTGENTYLNAGDACLVNLDEGSILMKTGEVCSSIINLQDVPWLEGVADVRQ